MKLQVRIDTDLLEELASSVASLRDRLEAGEIDAEEAVADARTVADQAAEFVDVLTAALDV